MLLDLVLVEGLFVDKVGDVLEFLVVLDLLLGFYVTQVDHFLDFFYYQSLQLLL